MIMRRILTGALVVLVILAATNPTRADYIAWAKDQFVADQESGLARLLMSTLGPLLEASTETHNYLFFSIFKTGEMVTLGILGRFVPLK